MTPLDAEPKYSSKLNYLLFKIVKWSTSYCLIPQTPNREPSSLAVAASVCIPNAVAQDAGPSIVCIGLRRTPPVTDAANGAVIAIVVAEPARKTSE